MFPPTTPVFPSPQILAFFHSKLIWNVVDKKPRHEYSPTKIIFILFKLLKLELHVTCPPLIRKIKKVSFISGVFGGLLCGNIIFHNTCVALPTVVVCC